MLLFQYSFGSLKKKERVFLGFAFCLFVRRVSAGGGAGLTTPRGRVLLIRGWVSSKQLYFRAPLSDPCQYPSPMTWRDSPPGKRGQTPCPSACAHPGWVMERFLTLTPMRWRPDRGRLLSFHVELSSERARCLAWASQTF